jgi:hypothetical protein
MTKSQIGDIECRSSASGAVAIPSNANQIVTALTSTSKPPRTNAKTSSVLRLRNIKPQQRQDHSDVSSANMPAPSAAANPAHNQGPRPNLRDALTASPKRRGPKGACAEIARNLGLSESFIVRVAYGQRRSTVVESELEQYRRAGRKVSERKIQLRDSRLPYAESFHRGGRYFGVSSRVARGLKLSPNTVHHVVQGRSRSTKVMDALLAEIARVDAELIELGRAFLQRTEAEEQIALLQKRLQGRLR